MTPSPSGRRLEGPAGAARPSVDGRAATRGEVRGHDAWILGDEQCVVVDWQGFADYAES